MLVVVCCCWLLLVLVVVDLWDLDHFVTLADRTRLNP